MTQIVQFGQIVVGNVADIPRGGMCAWRLPADKTCASVARSLLTIALTTLGVDRDTTDNVILAASELATNALNAGTDALAPLELWLWARTTPAHQLVMTVFDTDRSSWPDTTPRDLLDEHGKGLSIINMLTEAWGAHPTRSICTNGTPGKAVWTAFPLPGPWPNARTTAPPILAARHLATTLTARGIPNVTHRPGRGVSLVTIQLDTDDDLNIWIDPTHLTYTAPATTRHRRPIIDLHDTTETLIRRVERRSPRVGL